MKMKLADRVFFSIALTIILLTLLSQLIYGNMTMATPICLGLFIFMGGMITQEILTALQGS